MNKVGNLQATSQILLAELTPFTPTKRENLDHGIL